MRGTRPGKGQVWAQAVTSRDAQKQERDRQRKLHGGKSPHCQSLEQHPGHLIGTRQPRCARRSAHVLASGEQQSPAIEDPGLDRTDGSNSKSSRKSSRFGETKDDLPPAPSNDLQRRRQPLSSPQSARHHSVNYLPPEDQTQAEKVLRQQTSSCYWYPTGRRSLSPSAYPFRIASDAQARAL